MKLRGRLRVSLLTLLLLTLLIGAIGALRLKWTPWVLQRRYSKDLFEFDKASPDGRRITLNSKTPLDSKGSETPSVRVLDLESGTEQILPEDNAKFSPDSASLLSIRSDGTAHTWHGNSFATLKGPGIKEADFSPDSRLVVTRSESNERTQICLWDAATGEKRCDFNGSDAGPFSPDGRRLVTFNKSGDSFIWDTQTGKSVCKIHPDGFYSPFVSFSPDSRLLAVVEKNSLAIYDAIAGDVRKIVPLAGCRIRTFSPDGAWLSFRDENSGMQLLNVSTGSTRVVDENRRDIADMFLSKDLYYFYEVNRIEGLVCDLKQDITQAISKYLSLSPKESLAGGTDPRGDWVVSETGDDCSLWRLRDASRQATIRDFMKFAHPYLFISPDGARMLAYDRDGEGVSVWDCSSGIRCPLSQWDDNVDPNPVFAPDGLHIVLAHENHDTKIFFRCRGEGWTGLLSLPELWIASMTTVGLIWQLVRAFRPRAVA